MAPSETKQVRALVHGRVQGVFFRAWTQQTARTLQVKGWVRNLPDGSVELLAEGEESQLRALLAKCRQGPPAARVSEIEEEWSEAAGHFSDFEVTK